MKKHPIFAAAVSLAVLVPATAGAKVVSGTPFADNMVLQRGRAVPVWGVADPGEAVTVSSASSSRTSTAGYGFSKTGQVDLRSPSTGSSAAEAVLLSSRRERYGVDPIGHHFFIPPVSAKFDNVIFRAFKTAL